MEFKVEVRGDPYMGQQAGVGFFSSGDAAVGMQVGGNVASPAAVGMQMGGNASSPAAVGFQVHDNSHMQTSHAAVSMNMGMPAMSMQINDGTGGVAMSVPGVSISTNASTPAAVGFVSPNPVVSVNLPAAIGFSVSSAPAPAPAPVYGTDWNVTVQNPHTVGNAGEDQHTVYEFVLRTNLPEYGAQQYHLRKRRYSEARAFFKALSVQFDTSRFPMFPEKNFWGRFDSGVISQRMRAFQAMFGIIASDPRMRTSQLVKDFFFGSTTFGAPVQPSY